ncbi:MAG: hypothetical protein [Bacteriophage sp.]|nr:MAG: hypothetical protein [Bacteriophage sp.]
MEKAALPLNADQTLAADGFFEFLLNDSQKELNISGPGGVGKTYLMGYSIDEVIPRYHAACEILGVKPKYDGVVMTATTNKAADVLSQATGRSVGTVHSFFNLKVVDDYATGTQKISKTKDWMIHQNKIIFIDECSMIDKYLIEFIREGTMQCKIIYVGDHCQMAPVREKISKVYASNLPFFELREPMRTSDPHLHQLNNTLRGVVETGLFTGLQLVPGVIDHLDDVQFEQEINDHFLDPLHKHAILAYTNDRVIMYNSYIRQIRGLPPEFQSGEYVVNNSAIRLRKGMISVEEEVLIRNMDPISSMLDVEAGVQVEVRYCDIESQFGELHESVPVPVNRQHYSDLLRYYGRTKNWNRYFFLKNTCPDFRQRDARTVYKAQGSSYDTSYIDLNDISTCRDADQAARLLYVGASRARYRVAFYGVLAEKFGYLIQPE